jgi:hypothetical protein
MISSTSDKHKRKYRTNQHLQESNIITGSKRRHLSSNAVSHYWSAFVAASSLAPKARLHRSQLPPESRFWSDVQKMALIYKQGFIAACHKDLETIKRKNTFIKRNKSDLDLITEVLPLMWVFKYRFDSEGYLLKYTARICVRGDLQTTTEDTHAATLAVRIFRGLMAIAAYFNLEIRQYDAVNAFTNAHLPFPVFTALSEGFDDSTSIWELQRALYGLKTSPLLWYKDVTKTLEPFGLTPVLDCNCLYKSNTLIVFFYVDDIIVMARPAHQTCQQASFLIDLIDS